MKKLFFILLILLYSCAVDNYYSNRIYNIFDLIKINDLLFFKAKLNGKNVMFLIDTGSNKSLLDINKSEKYGYKYNKAGESIISIGGKENIYHVWGFTTDIFFIPFLGIDMIEISPYFKKDDMEIIGIIGSNTLNGWDAIIDYEQMKLYLKK
jgi:hypothetical protein